MSMVTFFSSTASLPRHSEASRAAMRSTAGPSLTPAAFASATSNFFSPAGWANCSAARLTSAPPCDSVALTDFRPVPVSVTRIASGATPSTSVSGDSAICGGVDSKRGHRNSVPPASAAATIRRRATSRVRLRRGRSAGSAFIASVGKVGGADAGGGEPRPDAPLGWRRAAAYPPAQRAKFAGSAAAAAAQWRPPPAARLPRPLHGSAAIRLQSLTCIALPAGPPHDVVDRRS
ncbi:MAG: hypothetical protein H6R03_1837 [Burkholderiaceae bacterium]|nr:hypothetical protein [Burkholderiaceae bacterium]